MQMGVVRGAEGAGPDPGAHSGGVVPAEMQRLPSEPVDKANHGPSLPQNEMKRLVSGPSSPGNWEIPRPPAP